MCDHSNKSCQRVQSNGTVCVITEKNSFSCKRNLLSVTIETKALNEYILIALFVVLLKRNYCFAFFIICVNARDNY